MGAGGTWRAVFRKHVLIAFTGCRRKSQRRIRTSENWEIAARETVVDETRDRTDEMTRHWQKSDLEFLLITGSRALRMKEMKINCRMK